MALVFLDRLSEAAAARALDETDYRAESRQRLAALEAERMRAYRRLNLVKEMAELARAEAACAQAVRAQTAWAAEETGWADGAEGYDAFCAEFAKVASLVHGAIHSADDQPAAAAIAVEDALAAFEAWHRARFGGEFLDRMKVEHPFYPVVDF